MRHKPLEEAPDLDAISMEAKARDFLDGVLPETRARFRKLANEYADRAEDWTIYYAIKTFAEREHINPNVLHGIILDVGHRVAVRHALMDPSLADPSPSPQWRNPKILELYEHYHWAGRGLVPNSRMCRYK